VVSAAIAAAAVPASAPGGTTVQARWEPEGLAPPDVDEEGRVVCEEGAAAIAARVARAEGGLGRVVRTLREDKSEPPPLPYSLAELQIDAARRLGLTAKQVLDAGQALYETHRLTTYPRSDCSHLPEAQLADGEAVLLAVALQAPDLAALAESANLSLRSRAWNDAKVTAHHAIIPTRSDGSTAPQACLPPTERAVYELIARRYVAQFLPAHTFALTRLELDLAGERFVTTGRETLSAGWRVAQGPSAERDRDEAEDAPGLAALHLREGQEVTITACECARRETKPPKPFTDATLLAAMVNVAAHVSDARVKAILSEVDGLGTPATRPAILETLFERGYLERRGRSIVSTSIGRVLIASLPAVATTPDMTAEWEAAMRDIAEGRLTMDAFLARITLQLGRLIEEGKARRVLPPPPPPPPLVAGAPARAFSERTSASAAPTRRARRPSFPR
jgi:DNA topoisomerase-3